MKPELFATSLCVFPRRPLTPFSTSLALHFLVVGAALAVPLLGAVELPPFQTVQKSNPERRLSSPAPQGRSAQCPRRRASSDSALSPYFFVVSDNPDLDQLPLKATSVEARITGVIAAVRLRQTYENTGRRALECRYVFPAPTHAAVHGMRMTIGQRVIVAELRERNRARREYEDARRQGKGASLLEEQRPNVFQMSVANILPGDVIQVELDYTDLLVPSERTYEFVFPAVVGPRYSNRPRASAPESETWVRSPYLRNGEAPQHTFDINVDLSSGLPLRELACVSHVAAIDYHGPRHASVRLANPALFGGNRDFVLRYRLADRQVEAGVLLSRGATEDYFLAMVQPPERVTPAECPPREYIFVMDVSGSMNGFPLSISKQLLKDLVTSLRPRDHFNLVLFSGSADVLSATSLPATEANLARALALIDGQSGGGGTELLPALRQALALPRPEANASRTFVIATDGLVDTEAGAFELVRTHLGQASFFPFGIGTSVNRHLIEGIARAGNAEPFVVARAAEAAAQAERFRRYVASPVLTQISMEAQGFDVSDLEPATLSDVLADRPLVVCGKWKGTPNGRLTFRGMSGAGPWERDLDVRESDVRGDSAPIESLWARHRIARLADDLWLAPDAAGARAVTQLALKHRLLSAYTSFVAVDTVQRSDGQVRRVEQPLPLPLGVSDLAVGDDAEADSFGGMAGGVAGGIAMRPAPLARRLAVRVAGSLVPPRKIHDVKPVYPEAARAAHVEGRVVLECTTNPEGRVVGVRVVRGIQLLDQAAIDAVRQWIYAPTLLNGVPVAVTMRVTVDFKL